MRGAQVLPKPKAHGYAGRIGISSKTADQYLKGRYSIASSLNEGCTLRPKWRGKKEPRSCPTRPEAGAISFVRWLQVLYLLYAYIYIYLLYVYIYIYSLIIDNSNPLSCAEVQ